MKPGELRIRNLVECTDDHWNRISEEDRIYFEDRIKEVLTIESTGIHYNEPFSYGGIYQLNEADKSSFIYYSAIKPIPLIKDWLVKFNFIMSPYHDGGKIKITKELHLEIRFHKDQILSYLRYGDHVHQRHELNNIDYVHQLQNIYFDFKRKELEITIEA